MTRDGTARASASDGSRFEISFDIECNVNFSYTVRSVYGALRSAYRHEDVDGIGYAVRITLPHTSPSRVEQFRSEELAGPENAARRVNVVIGTSALKGNALIEVVLDPRSWTGLEVPDEMMAGNYTDVLEVTLDPLN